jgi:hypothetical protein
LSFSNATANISPRRWTGTPLQTFHQGDALARHCKVQRLNEDYNGANLKPWVSPVSFTLHKSDDFIQALPHDDRHELALHYTGPSSGRPRVENLNKEIKP